CLEKDPSRRYQTARGLADDLEAWQDYRPITARAPGFVERAVKLVRRRPIHAVLIGVSILLLLTHGIAAPLTALKQIDLRGQAERAQQEEARYRLIAALDKQAALEAKANAERIATDYRMLAYSYSMRLAAAIGRTDRLSSQGILRAFKPTPSQQDLRGWEWYFNFADVYHEPIYFDVGKNAIKTLSFSPTGRFLAVASDNKNGSVLRDGFHGAIIRALNDPTGSHSQIVWGRDDKYLATLSTNGEVCYIWNAENGKQVTALSAESTFLSLSWNHQNNQIIALTDDNVIRVWDVSNTAAISETYSTQAVVEKLTKIFLSPNGQYLAALTMNGSDVFIWSVNQMAQPPIVLSGHDGFISALAWHRDGRWLATSDHVNGVRIWEVPSGARLAKLHDSNQDLISSLVWASNGMQLLFGGEKNLLYSFDLLNGQRSIHNYNFEETNSVSIS
ncbi:MAG: hypothetical protein MI744_13200, partial [Pseudomonadales bacterium]|nr:hypothetical protein [Pseudomonadales bacterium]